MLTSDRFVRIRAIPEDPTDAANSGQTSEDEQSADLDSTAAAEIKTFAPDMNIGQKRETDNVAEES